MKIHLVDGTFELFRSYYGSPSSKTADGFEIGAVRGLLRSMLALLAEPGVTHVAIAFDHVIESFRNDLYPGYKTGDGIDPKLFAQFVPAEDACRALGIVTWPMIEFECDDALAAGAAKFASLPEVEQVVICSPDKDLAQCVIGTRVVCLDRMRRRVLDDPGVRAKFGVGPKSMPDWLALVGDISDGYPGIARWGAKSAASVLAVYEHLERIPDDAAAWSVAVRGADVLAKSLRENRDAALLYRRLATLRTDVPLAESLDDLRWRGAHSGALAALSAAVVDDWTARRAVALAAEKG
jgi:5'-3' exonuclease